MVSDSKGLVRDQYVKQLRESKMPMDSKMAQIVITGGWREEDYKVRPMGRVAKSVLAVAGAYVVVCLLVLAPVIAFADAKWVESPEITEVPANVKSQIKRDAMAEFPGDYDMIKYIVKTEGEAFLEFVNFNDEKVPLPVLTEIVNDALKEFPGQWSLITYVIKSQTQSYKDLFLD